MSNLNQELNHLLADMQVYYQLLRNYHWNVSGPGFFELHAKFEELYTEAADQIDEIAERILSRKERPISTLSGFLDVSGLKEDDSVREANAMVQSVHDTLGYLVTKIRAIQDLADKEGDVATTNLLDDIADGQEKTAWMMRSYLK